MWPHELPWRRKPRKRIVVARRRTTARPRPVVAATTRAPPVVSVPVARKAARPVSSVVRPFTGATTCQGIHQSGLDQAAELVSKFRLVQAREGQTPFPSQQTQALKAAAGHTPCSCLQSPYLRVRSGVMG